MISFSDIYIRIEPERYCKMKTYHIFVSEWVCMGFHVFTFIIGERLQTNFEENDTKSK